MLMLFGGKDTSQGLPLARVAETPPALPSVHTT